jgi:pyruvate/2-oxoacid:ferredoxin oxidoreductase alpha subunit
MPPIHGYIAGLGGRDIMVDSFKEAAAHALAKDRADEEIVWIGVKK